MSTLLSMPVLERLRGIRLARRCRPPEVCNAALGHGVVDVYDVVATTAATVRPKRYVAVGVFRRERFWRERVRAATTAAVAAAAAAGVGIDILRSVDGGATWAAVEGNGAHTRPVCVAYSAPQRRCVVAGDHGYIGVSDDDGLTWMSVSGTVLGDTDDAAFRDVSYDERRVAAAVWHVNGITRVGDNVHGRSADGVTWTWTRTLS
jgi:hypothetical protein